MYRMPLNYNPEKKSKSAWNQLFAVKPRNSVNSIETVNSNKTMNSKASMSSEGTMNPRDNVYSNEFFDTNSGMNYKNQSEKTSSLDFNNLSPKKLQEAIIWSEILGKPVSKREKRR